MNSKLRSVAAVIALSVVPLSVSAAAQQQEEADIVVKGKGDTITDEPDPVICKTIRQTGSRLGEKRVCRRESQMKRDQAETQRGIAQKTQSKPHQGN